MGEMGSGPMVSERYLASANKAAAPSERGAAGELASRVQGIGQRVTALADRVRSVADRAYGSVPTATEKGGPDYANPGEVHEANASVAALEGRLDELEHEIERIRHL